MHQLFSRLRESFKHDDEYRDEVANVNAQRGFANCDAEQAREAWYLHFNSFVSPCFTSVLHFAW